jgi:hypothetical protein
MDAVEIENLWGVRSWSSEDGAVSRWGAQVAGKNNAPVGDIVVNRVTDEQKFGSTSKYSWTSEASLRGGGATRGRFDNLPDEFEAVRVALEWINTALGGSRAFSRVIPYKG